MLAISHPPEVRGSHLLSWEERTLSQAAAPRKPSWAGTGVGAGFPRKGPPTCGGGICQVSAAGLEGRGLTSGPLSPVIPVYTCGQIFQALLCVLSYKIDKMLVAPLFPIALEGQIFCFP